MRALKLLVIILGVLLLTGIGAVVAGVVWRINHTSPLRAVAAVQRIALPPASKVVAVDVSAGRLVVRTDAPSGVRILIFDLATGAAITTIEFAPSTP